MSYDRIGSSCYYRVFELNELSEWKTGKLRAWSLDHIGDGLQHPAGIIEDDETMMCVSTLVSLICFSSIPPNSGF